MQFASYSAFRTAVQQMIDGDDISQSDLSVAVLDLMIAAGERRLYRDVRSSTQDTAYSLVVASNAVTLPADAIELKGAPYVPTFPVVVYAPWEAVQNAIQLNAGLGGGTTLTANPAFYSFEGDTIIFYPKQPDGTTVTGRYYKKFSDISGGLNTLFNRHPDLFLYAALAESAPFIGEMTRLSVWEGKYTGLVQSANEEERRRQTRGSKLQTRVA